MEVALSSSCGSCIGLVEAILASTVGEGYDASPNKQAMCKCTEYSHDEVIAFIKANELKSMQAVRDFLEWKSIETVPEGHELRGQSLNINGDSSVSDNPNRYKQHGFYFNADNCIDCHAR